MAVYKTILLKNTIYSKINTILGKPINRYSTPKEVFHGHTRKFWVIKNKKKNFTIGFIRDFIFK